MIESRSVDRAMRGRLEVRDGKRQVVVVVED